MSQLSMFKSNGHSMEAAPGLVDDRLASAPPAPTRPVPTLAGNPEEDAKDRILALHEYTSAGILAELRERMRVLFMKKRSSQGSDAYVTADDARVILDADPNVPPPSQLSRNFMGSLFSGSKEWEPTGQYVKSRTARSHGNPVKCWRWVGRKL